MRRLVRNLLLPAVVGLGLGLGVLREVVVAREIGAGAAMDAYAAVFTIYLFFGTQMANATELTFISRHAGRDDEALTERLLSVLVVQCLLMLPIVLVLTWFAAPLVGLLFAFEPQREGLAAEIARAFVPAMFLGAQVGVLRAALNIKERFVPGFLVGPLLSISVIGLLLISDRPDVMLLPRAYWLGNLLVLALLGYLLFRVFRGVPRRLSLREGWSLWRFGYLVVIAEVVILACSTLERSVASGFPVGTVSSFFYATALTSVFVALVVQPVSVVYFPRLSRLYKSAPAEGTRLLTRVGGLLFFSSLGVVLVVELYAQPLVALVFQRGAFGPEDTLRTARMLEIVVWALPFMGTARMIKNALYARGSYLSPVVLNLVRLGVFLLFVWLLLEDLGVAGFAWAFVAALASVPLTGLIFLARPVALEGACHES